ncbi:MAG: hypothetical protein ABWW65_04895 [Thermoprotei archaeon]
MGKYHRVFRSSSTEKLANICKLILFSEDVVEDAECQDLLVDSSTIGFNTIVVEPVNCVYDPGESIGVYSEKYGLKATIGSGDKSFRELYEYVVEFYSRNIHGWFLSLVTTRSGWSREYYLGVLLDGSAFIAEGEEEYISLPGIQQCFSAHTHPSLYPIPSSMDFKSIVSLLADRGIGHVIAAKAASLALYRVAPLTLNEYEYLNSLNYRDPVKVLRELNRLNSIRVRYI